VGVSWRFIANALPRGEAVMFGGPPGASRAAGECRQVPQAPPQS